MSKKRNGNLNGKQKKAKRKENSRKMKTFEERFNEAKRKPKTLSLTAKEEEPAQETEILDTDKVYMVGDVKVIKRDDTPRNRKFEKLVLKDQRQLKAYLSDYFIKEGKSVVEGKGYLFVDGTYPVLLSAHLDTVHHELPKEIIYSNGAISSPQGIGGDDRCGVYAIMRILKEIDCPVLFCEDEETGGIGSSLFVESELCDRLFKEDRLRYVIDLDRKGSKDAVYYSLDNRDFEYFVEKQWWKYDWGSFTDICTICPALGIAGVNLSVGYYKQHTKQEYVVLKDMDKAIEEAKALIKRTDPEVTFEYKEAKSPYASWGNWGGYGKYDGYYDDWDWWSRKSSTATTTKKEEEYIPTEWYYVSYYSVSGEQVEFIEALSEQEAIGKFLSEHPDMTFNDIFDVGYEDDYDWTAFEKYGYDSVTVTR